MNTGNPGLVGKDVRELKDASGMPFAWMMLDMARRGEGTIRYTFPRGGAKTPLEKVAYVRGFGPWHLMIASAEYMTDLDVTLSWHPHRRAPTVFHRDRVARCAQRGQAAHSLEAAHGCAQQGRIEPSCHRC
jgi:methyl-accepting chemotaxis protein